MAKKKEEAPKAEAKQDASKELAKDAEEFAKQVELGLKQRGSAKQTYIGSRLAVFASKHGAKAANELHAKHKLADIGLSRVSG